MKRSRLLLAVVTATSLFALPVMYAQQTTSAPPAPPAAAAPQGGTDRIDTALVLLDRIDRLVTAARRDVDTGDLAAVGTSGRAGATAEVTIRAADLDEIHANIAQIKLLLKPSGM